jgi:hypothetical protein
VEGAAGYAGSAAHVFTHDGDDCDVGVHSDVIDDLVREVLREFAAQRIESTLRVGLGRDKAFVVLGLSCASHRDFLDSLFPHKAIQPLKIQTSPKRFVVELVS